MFHQQPMLYYRECLNSMSTLGRVLKLAETLDFVGALPPQNQALKQRLVQQIG
jgi:hypothetical protein